MSFANPWMLILALPLGVAAWRLLRRANRSGIRYSATVRLPVNAAGWRAKLASLTPYVMLAGLALMIVAVARPRSPIAHEKKSIDAIAIAMTVDVSGSMDALDLTPKGERFSRQTTRLAVVKKLFAEFVEKRPDDLIGLVTFGGYASTRSPLTADHEALLNVLKGVEIPSIALDAQGRQIAGDEQMTAVGDGLATALARLKDAKPKSKIVILLSDGVSNTGAVEPDEAAKAAAKMGVKVYAIGVGTRARRTPIFGRDFFGRETVQYADMTFDEKQLKTIAKTTGGTYFPVNDRDSLEKALEEIDQLETTELDADAYDRWEEHFVFFLVGGALLVLLAVTLSMAASRRYISLALLLLSVVGCRLDRYTLTEPIDGRTFEVKSGDRIRVVLDENARTGFVWMTECDDSDVSFARETIAPDDDAPGKVRIIIRVHRGFDETAHVRLVNRQPWDGGETARVIDLVLHRKPEDNVPWK